jgi:hypothetical protein
MEKEKMVMEKEKEEMHKYDSYKILLLTLSLPTIGYQLLRGYYGVMYQWEKDVDLKKIWAKRITKDENELALLPKTVSKWTRIRLLSSAGIGMIAFSVVSNNMFQRRFRQWIDKN